MLDAKKQELDGRGYVRLRVDEDTACDCFQSPELSLFTEALWKVKTKIQFWFNRSYQKS